MEACAVRSGQRSRRRGSGGLLALRVDAWPPRGWSGRAPRGAAVSGGRRCPLGLWLGGGASGFTLGSCQPPSALDLSARHIPCFRPKLIVHSNVSKWFENAIFFFLKKKIKKLLSEILCLGRRPRPGEPGQRPRAVCPSTPTRFRPLPRGGGAHGPLSIWHFRGAAQRPAQQVSFRELPRGGWLCGSAWTRGGRSGGSSCRASWGGPSEVGGLWRAAMATGRERAEGGRSGQEPGCALPGGLARAPQLTGRPPAPPGPLLPP